MIVLKILLWILLLVILLVFFVPYGIDAAYEDQVLSLRIKAGPIRVAVWPRKPPSARQRERARR